jgi:hypothetical protein
MEWGVESQWMLPKQYSQHLECGLSFQKRD